MWDVRNLLNPLVLTKLDTSPGIVTPLFDPDTNMLYLSGKGDTSIRWLEIDPSNASSPITPGALPFMSNTTFAGATLVPKLALNVMQGEVARILAVASDGGSVVPITVTVPRKSYMEFHSDIFPDTKSTEPALSSSEWFDGQTKLCNVVSLDPKKRSTWKPDAVDVTAKLAGAFISAVTPSTAPKSTTTPPTTSSPTPTPVPVTSALSTPPSTSTPVANNNAPSPVLAHRAVDSPISPTPSSPPSSTRPKFVAPKSSSYRFVTGKANSKFDDLRGLSINMPSECNGLEANDEFLAIPIAGPGGRLAIWPTSQTGRLPVRLPCVLCGTDLLDFKWNPFDKRQFATGSEDGKVPAEGYKEDSTEPAMAFTAHTNRITFMQYHPTVSDLLLTASPEQGSPTAKVWNLKTQRAIATLPHPDMILSGAFSLDGRYVATACRDKSVRIFDARTDEEVQKGPSHEGIKGCRVLWLGDSGKICTVGFGRASQREINIYDSTNLAKPLSTTVIDTSPSLLIPVFDEDTNLLYLVGRGETYIPLYEITDTGATFLTRFESPGIQQGVSFLPKRTCDIRSIEIAKAWRMTQTAVESLSFTVPRLKKELFQDDIYVPTRDVENAALTVEEWLAGKSGTQKKIDLAPSDMTPLSQASVLKVEKKVVTPLQDSHDEGKRKEQTMKEMFEQAKESGQEQLEQDKMEGVADDEWDD
ncbi:Coronin-7 [Rhizophlyctis rosea]|uniref:Coronin n=1 Tax=Rhizophlyctis rosea TaxID=64517 RepID=A0AAD5S9X7_9FUNG|nr:Coronin-7 [Rhizophlyctis rosea]